MKRTRALILSTCAMLAISLFAGCGNGKAAENGDGNSSGDGNKEVKITFFNTSAEVNNQFEELFEVYHKVNPDVTIELIPTPIGGQQIEKFQALIASKTPPTISNLDPGHIYIYKDMFLDLESEKAWFEEEAQPGSIESSLLDGKFLGIPYTVQGYGLQYNKRALEEAIGGTFDPSTIKTQNDLEELFKKVEASGKAPVLIHGANWSVGAHFLGLNYALQSTDVEENREFVQALKDGEVDLSSNAVFNGLLDTFDILKEYNIRAKDPLVADFAKDAQDFATGEVPFFFMGDWLWSTIGNLEGIDDEYGFIPVPISNNADDYGNTQVVVSQPKLLAIDNSGSTPEQQAAAKEFIKWMLTSDEGHNALVREMGFNVPYKGVEIESTNVPAKAIAQYISEGKTIDLSIFNYLPADYWVKTGDSMLKYLAGKIDRQELTKEVEDYWKTVK